MNSEGGSDEEAAGTSGKLKPNLESAQFLIGGNDLPLFSTCLPEVRLHPVGMEK